MPKSGGLGPCMEIIHIQIHGMLIHIFPSKASVLRPPWLHGCTLKIYCTFTIIIALLEAIPAYLCTGLWGEMLWNMQHEQASICTRT